MPDQPNDPIVLYVIVRQELNMSPGKIASQACHGVQKFLLNYFRLLAFKAKLHETLPAHEEACIGLTTEWLGNGSRKVVLKANEKEWSEVRETYGKDCFVVSDCGLTEVVKGSETCMVLSVMRKSQASKHVKELSAL